MTPVFCQVKHGPENGSHGDCLRACVASVLDMTSESVPHFFHDGCEGDIAMERITAFLATLALSPFYCSYPGAWALQDILEHHRQQNPTTTYILFGAVETGEDHAVVCKGGEEVHNPSWIAANIVGPGSTGHWTLLVIAR